tara:strand:+ start:393 stop:506 length:114 start_codon:yes stop_codon:yes gene_type:complete
MGTIEASLKTQLNAGATAANRRRPIIVSKLIFALFRV